MNHRHVANLSWYSIALMALTSVHHIYGAIIYHTPWRLHVLLISFPVIAITLGLVRFYRTKEQRVRPIAFWFFLAITLIPSIGLIGVFEGLYNHVLKNILFFGGASARTLRAMFPAPKYEMPNDFLFELSGVLQGVLVLPMLVIIVKMIKSSVSPKPTG